SFVLMAFGGGGPMMAAFLARELGIKTVLIPATPGVLSALGGLVSDTKNDFIQTVYEMLEPGSIDTLRTAYAALAERAQDWLKEGKGSVSDAKLILSADVRYAGQSFEIETPIERKWIDDGDVASIAASFHKQH